MSKVKFLIFLCLVPTVLALVLACCEKTRTYTKEELEEGLLSIELVLSYDYTPEKYLYETIRVFNTKEQQEIIEEISNITFVQATSPGSRVNPSYSLLFKYSDWLLEFSLYNAIGESDLNGKPYNGKMFFPARYNEDLATLINKYLSNV